MRKNIYIVCLLFLFIYINIIYVYPEGPVLLDVRNKFFEESNKIKLLLAKSEDPGVIINLWNSCIMTIIQLNAYFYMLSIFDSVKSGILNDDPTFYLEMWLKELKKTNELNIKNLDTQPKTIQPETKIYVNKLKTYYIDLNKKIDEELVKIGAVSKTLSVKRPY